MTRNKTVTQIQEDKKDKKELKRLERSPRTMVKDEYGVLSVKSWGNMSPLQRLIDQRRRNKEVYHNKPKRNPSHIHVVFRFTTEELGIPPPSQEDIDSMMKINPRLARRYKYFKPLDHAMEVPSVLTRDLSKSFSQQWKEEREKVKNHIITSQIDSSNNLQKLKNETGYDSNEPSLDVSTLTTAGDK